jgi:hypothetical protein
MEDCSIDARHIVDEQEQMEYTLLYAEQRWRRVF